MLNHIDIMGRFTKEPEMRTTQTGKSVCSFTVAVDRDYDRSVTDFFSCTAWNSTAEFVSKNFHKGQLAAVSGAMHSRDWTDKSGNKRQSWDIKVDNIYFGGDKRQSADVSAADFTEIPDDEELPF